MKLFSTEIHAICPVTKRLAVFSGEKIPAETAEEAHRWAQDNGKGYLHVLGLFIEEIPSQAKFIKMLN